MEAHGKLNGQALQATKGLCNELLEEVRDSWRVAMTFGDGREHSTVFVQVGAFLQMDDILSEETLTVSDIQPHLPNHTFPSDVRAKLINLSMTNV